MSGRNVAVSNLLAAAVSLNSSAQKEHPVFVSLLLPAFNEEDHIERLLHEVLHLLDAMGKTYEIVLVDDGSTDETRVIAAKEIEWGPIKVVGYSLNAGKGYALKYGSKFASGEFTIFLDSDLEVDSSHLNLYLEALHACDIAIASKRSPGSRVDAPFLRRMLSLYFNYIVKLLTGIRITDTQSGLKAFRTDALRKIMPLVSVKRYAFDVELLTVASLLKMRIAELPIDIKLNTHFKFKEIVRMSVDLAGITYRLRLRRWYQKNLKNGSANYNPLINW